MSEVVPNNLRSWRSEKDVTQQEVSELTGLSRSYVCRLEQGQRTAPPLTKVMIARRLGVAVADLFPVDCIEVRHR